MYLLLFYSLLNEVDDLDVDEPVDSDNETLLQRKKRNVQGKSQSTSPTAPAKSQSTKPTATGNNTRLLQFIYVVFLEIFTSINFVMFYLQFVKLKQLLANHVPKSVSKFVGRMPLKHSQVSSFVVDWRYSLRPFRR